VSATSKPWLVAALVWTAAILTVNSISVTDAPIRTFSGADKIAHAGIYAVAAFAWRSAFRMRNERTSLWIVFAIAMLGALDEWHQLAVPGRSGDVRDWFADVVGALLGVIVWRLVYARRGAAV
jgi:VanZ family protein